MVSGPHPCDLGFFVLFAVSVLFQVSVLSCLGVMPQKEILRFVDRLVSYILVDGLLCIWLPMCCWLGGSPGCKC